MPGTFSCGFSVIDGRDPRTPTPVNHLAAADNTWSINLQSHDDLLLVINAKEQVRDDVLKEETASFGGSIAGKVDASGQGYSAGLKVYDISTPEQPREIGFMAADGPGAHRIC